ncbi:MAG: hypothetical protein WDW36_007363 [Sanguina aurantia]
MAHTLSPAWQLALLHLENSTLGPTPLHAAQALANDDDKNGKGQERGETEEEWDESEEGGEDDVVELPTGGSSRIQAAASIADADEAAAGAAAAAAASAAAAAAGGPVKLSAAAYRQLHEMKVDAADTPDPIQDFKGGDFPAPILRAIEKAGYSAPSSIQAQAWPVLLAGRDVVAIASTGSGKTAGFLLPALVAIKGAKADPHKVQGLVPMSSGVSLELFAAPGLSAPAVQACFACRVQGRSFQPGTAAPAATATAAAAAAAGAAAAHTAVGVAAAGWTATTERASVHSHSPRAALQQHQPGGWTAVRGTTAGLQVSGGERQGSRHLTVAHRQQSPQASHRKPVIAAVADKPGLQQHVPSSQPRRGEPNTPHAVTELRPPGAQLRRAGAAAEGCVRSGR